MTLLAALLALATAGSVQAESASITATVSILAVEVDLQLSTPEARVGDKVRADATVRNRGWTGVVAVVVAIRVDGAGLAVKGKDVTLRLAAGKSGKASWTLCGLEPGNYVVLARATAGSHAVDGPARLLSVSGAARKSCL